MVDWYFVYKDNAECIRISGNGVPVMRPPPRAQAANGHMWNTQ